MQRQRRGCGGCGIRSCARQNESHTRRNPSVDAASVAGGVAAGVGFVRAQGSNFSFGRGDVWSDGGRGGILAAGSVATDGGVVAVGARVGVTDHREPGLAYTAGYGRAMARFCVMADDFNWFCLIAAGMFANPE